MSAELVLRASIKDLENVIAERDETIRGLAGRILELGSEVSILRQKLARLEGAPLESCYTPVNAPLEFTETPGTYVPVSKPSEAELRARQALLQINAETIKEWEETEQALRRAAMGLLPGEVDNSNSK